MTNGWFKVAAFLAATIPAATVIMAVDHFLLPRLFRVSRPLTHVPAWTETAFINVPGLAALVPAVLVGTIGSGVFPGLADQYWGLPALEGWALAAVLYIAGVAVVYKLPSVRTVLGFSRPLLRADIPLTDEPIDIASEAEAATRPLAASVAPA